MNTSNPALNPKEFSIIDKETTTSKKMTIKGTINKVCFLFILVILSFAFALHTYYNSLHYPEIAISWLWGSIIGCFMIALITMFNKSWSLITSSVYAIFEGLFIGCISTVGVTSIINAQFSKIALLSVTLTFGVLFCFLLAYKFGLVNSKQKVKSGIIVIVSSIFLLYLSTFVLRFYNLSIPYIHKTIPYIHETGLLGIGTCLFIAIIAALNLILDFYFIEQKTKDNMPKYMEWYAAFGLIITLSWLYIEILSLIDKLRVMLLSSLRNKKTPAKKDTNSTIKARPDISTTKYKSNIIVKPISASPIKPKSNLFIKPSKNTLLIKPKGYYLTTQKTDPLAKPNDPNPIKPNPDSSNTTGPKANPFVKPDNPDSTKPKSND